MKKPHHSSRTGRIADWRAGCGPARLSSNLPALSSKLGGLSSNPLALSSNPLALSSNLGQLSSKPLDLPAERGGPP